MPSDLPLFPDLRVSRTPQPACAKRVHTVLEDAIATGRAGYMTRSAELLLAGLCARFIVERLETAGLMIVTVAQLEEP